MPVVLSQHIFSFRSVSLLLLGVDSVFWEVCYSPTAHITYHLKLPNLLYSIHRQLSNPIHLWGFFPRCEINAEHIIVYTVHVYSNLESEVNPAPTYLPT